MPFKMMGKSPLMKKLVGNQSKLPEHLKAKIEAAPESPAKFIPGLSQLFSSEPKKINYPKVDKFEQDKIDKENLRKKLEKQKRRKKDRS